MAKSNNLVFVSNIRYFNDRLDFDLPCRRKILPVIVSKTKLAKVNGVFQMTYKTLDLFLNAAATLLITWVSLDFTVIISAVFLQVL